MSRGTILFAIITSVALLSCAARKYRLTHDFPAAMSATIKADYIRQWEKGRVLYGMTCARCHNMREGRHEVVPDFPPDKVMGYELRTEHIKHGAELSDADLTAEDLGMIVIFLTYKRKNPDGVGKWVAPTAKEPSS